MENLECFIQNLHSGGKVIIQVRGVSVSRVVRFLYAIVRKCQNPAETRLALIMGRRDMRKDDARRQCKIGRKKKKKDRRSVESFFPLSSSRGWRECTDNEHSHRQDKTTTRRSLRRTGRVTSRRRTTKARFLNYQRHRRINKERGNNNCGYILKKYSDN